MVGVQYKIITTIYGTSPENIKPTCVCVCVCVCQLVQLRLTFYSCELEELKAGHNFPT